MVNRIFSGAAYYYSRYRPPYPQALLQDVVRQTVGTSGRHMVDWGCGTGEAALPLSSFFAEVVAVDIDAEMIALAREKAAAQHVVNVRWVVGPAESLDLSDGSTDLIVAGSSFHWMDRELLARRAHRALTERGAIGIIGGGSNVWDVTCGWHEVAVTTLKRWLGEHRRAGSGTYTVAKKHEDYLEPAGFQLECRDYRVEHVWTADSIVGFLYSTSFASPAVLGERREGFEADLRAGLARLSSADSFPEVLDFYLMIGRR